MALNFPDSPTNGQKYTDPFTGETWTYESSTNSWTSDGLTTAVGIQYKGGIDITAAPPAGVANGWQYTVTTGGAVNPGFTGLTGTVPAGTTVIYDGANWQEVGAGVKWVRNGTDLTPVHAGDNIFTSGEVKIGGTTAAPKTQLKGDGSATFGGNLSVPSLNGGQIAGFRNILINGDLAINQRGLDVASVAVGKYGQDRWKKTAGGMTQIIEEGSFEPGATYTLSGTGVTTQQLTAPASGHWTLPDIPVTARKVQLEPGLVATPFERRPVGTELALCQRYYCKSNIDFDGSFYVAVVLGLTDAYCFHVPFPVTMRTSPTETRDSLWKIGSSAGSSVMDINALRRFYPNGAWYGVLGNTATGPHMMSLRQGEPSPTYDAEL